MTTETQYNLVLSEEFLSGDVKSRHRKLSAAAIHDPDLLREVEALEAVLPQDVDLTQVFINPGAHWIPVHEYANFCRDVLDVSVKIFRTDSTSFWEVTPTSSSTSTANVQTYGLSWPDVTSWGKQVTRSLTGLELFQMTLNGKVPSLRVRRGADGDRQKDPALTANAIEKQSKLREAFTRWCLDGERKERLQALYNNQCNNIRLRTYDGERLHLNMTKQWLERVLARPYQKDGILRGLTGNLIDDVMSSLGIYWQMGLGKTITGIGIAAERILNQTANRVMIVVKKTTLEDFAETLSSAYPQIKAQVAREEDLSVGKRDLFLARVVFNQPQIIIVTHEQFAQLSIRRETEAAWIQAHINKMNADKTFLQGQGARSESVAIKHLMRAIERAKNKLEKVKSKHTSAFSFEDLNIDFMIVDEADVYKNGSFFTKMTQVAGIQNKPSGRAEDFDLKLWVLENEYGEGRVVQMTGTFVSNSLVELWRVMMHLCPSQMKLRGWHLFDAWAAACGHIKTGAVISATGTIKRESRFCEFVNFPEQLALLHSVADIRTLNSVGIDLNEPKPKYVNVAVPMTPLQRRFMDTLVARSNAISRRSPQIFYRINKEGEEEPFLDNPLFVTTHGRLACLDYRLIEEDARDYYKTKVNVCARRVAKIWHKTKEEKAVQIIFCDLGVLNAKKSFTLYESLRQYIIALGVDPGEIAIAQEWEAKDKRKKLHQMMREGLKRVVIASTEMLGVGANVHKRLLALHHLDVKWRPRDMMQREGRAIRPGNIFGRVLIYRYITQGVDGNVGFDSFVWDRVKMKIRFIHQLFSGTFNIRRVEEDASEDPAFSAAEIVALATGDPRLMEYVELEAQLQLNQLLLSGYRQELDQILHYRRGSQFQSCIPALTDEIETLRFKLENQQESADDARQILREFAGDGFQMEVDGETFTSRKEAAQALWEIADRVKDELQEREVLALREAVGYFGKFTLSIQVETGGFYYFLLSNDKGVYDCRMLKDLKKCIPRLEELLETIARGGEKIREDLTKTQSLLEAAKTAAADLEQRIEGLTETIARDEALKRLLEDELNLSDSKDEMATIDFDEDDED